MTSGPPTERPEATLPSASIRMADGVPEAPNASPVRNPWSSRIVDSKPCSRFASAAPVEMSTSCGAPSGRSFSQLLISSTSRWQNPQPGFQKRSAVRPLRISSRFTSLPSRSGSCTFGALPPTGTPRGAAGASGSSSPAAEASSRFGASFLRSEITVGPPTARPEAILPSAPTSTADGVPLAPNARPTLNPESRTTGEDNPSSRFRSTSPVETTRSLGASSRLVRLPGLEVVEHALAEAAARVPEQDRRGVAGEVSQLHRFAVQIVQLDDRRVFTDAGDSPRGLSVGSGPLGLDGSGQCGESRSRHRHLAFGGLLHQGANRLRASGRRATDRSVRPHQYRRRRPIGLIGVGYFVVFLHEDMGQVVLLCLVPVVLERPARDDGNGEFFGEIALPLADVTHHRIARAATGIGKEQEHRLLGRTQRIECHRLAIETGQAERRRGSSEGEALLFLVLVLFISSSSAISMSASSSAASIRSSRTSKRPF